ncbi:unnamed protein product [Paramecium primaurelia]|uniref:EF-hand domain-containing protein n=1 Tax=Paramecium primaurelia TaxID=5886 RepID=A0A8S1PU81_PARPR|nr:unnamed protein product [Paramecium primaurelia]
MDKTKEQIQEYFNIFDKDGSGSIDKEEIKELAVNVGLNWNDQKLNKIIQALDTNGDGKISFDEFYEYFLYGEQKQMDKLIQKKFKHIKNVKNLHKKLNQEYAHIFNKNNEEGKSQCSIQLNVGEKSQAKSALEFTVRVGEENKNFSQSLLKNFPYAGDQIVSIVFGFKCQNSDAVQEKFEAFFEGIIDLALNMIPEDISQKIAVFKNDLKIEYKALPDELLVRFYMNNELTENVLVAYRLISGMFIQENSSIFANLKLQFSAGLADIGASPNENIINWVAKGFSASFDATASSDLIEYARQGHYAAIGKYFESYKVKVLEQLTPLTLMNNARLQFNFQSYEQFIQEMQLPELNEVNLSVAVDQAKGANVNELIGGIPFVGELLDILRVEGNGQIQLAVISQEASVTITASGEGAALIWEKLI